MHGKSVKAINDEQTYLYDKGAPIYASLLLGNLGWALMQQNNYIEAEDAYRRALVIAPDNNKMCNLGICLMKQGRLGEAKDTLRLVKPAVVDGPRGVDSHLKASKPKPKMVLLMRMQISNPNIAANGNVLMGQVAKKTVMGPLVNSLNIDTRPFYVSNVVKSSVGNESVAEGLKRSRSGNAAAMVSEKETEVGNKARRKSGSPEKNSDWSELLPDSKDFEDAIIAAVLRGRSKRGSKCFKTSPRPLVQELDEFNITDFTYF